LTPGVDDIKLFFFVKDHLHWRSFLQKTHMKMPTKTTKNARKIACENAHRTVHGNALKNACKKYPKMPPKKLRKYPLKRQ
jgi:hypothetical protein